jgi:hypothetical protein
MRVVDCSRHSCRCFLGVSKQRGVSKVIFQFLLT